MVAFSRGLKRYAIGVVLIALFIIGAVTTENFFTVRNITNVLRQISVVGVLALAESILIICGQIDLSLGSVVAFSGILSTSAYLSSGSLAFGILMAILLATCCLVVSGILISKLKLTAFIVTMAMGFIARGLCFLWTGGQSIYDIKNYGVISTTYIGVIPLPVIILFFCVVVCAFIMNRTVLGRSIFAVGGNKEAASASGINVNRTILYAYILGGILTGIATVLQIARVNSAIPSTADGYEGDAIAGAIIGGTSFSGGVGTMVGVLLGSAIMGFLSNLLNLLGFDSYFQMVTKGVIIILALILDNALKSRKVKAKCAD